MVRKMNSNERHARGAGRLTKALDRYIAGTALSEQALPHSWAQRWAYVAGICTPIERHLQGGRVRWE
jgi:hypothetical protein